MAASALSVAVLQGGLTLVGWLLGDVLPMAQIDALTVAGGIILGGLSLRLLAIKEIRVADLLPGLVMAPVAVWLVVGARWPRSRLGRRPRWPCRSLG